MAIRKQILHKLQTKMDELNRLQDAWMSVLNPFLRADPVPSRYRATVASTEAQYPVMPAPPDPSAPGAEIDQPIIRVVNDGVDEKLMVCLRKADGSYAWKTITVT
jgi:hypothetical protein